MLEIKQRVRVVWAPERCPEVPSSSPAALSTIWSCFSPAPSTELLGRLVVYRHFCYPTVPTIKTKECLF